MTFQAFSAFGSGRRSSAPSAAAALTGAAIILGTGRVGEVHSVGGYILAGTPQPALGFSWKINGVERATTATYIPVAADLVAAGGGGYSSAYSSAYGADPTLTCTVSAANAGGTATPLTTTGIRVIPAGPVLTLVVIDQEDGGRTGDMFTATISTVAETVNYQWKLNGAALPGAVNADWLATDAGLLTIAATVTVDGITSTYESTSVHVYHCDFAGRIASESATTALASFPEAQLEITGQAFIILVDYEGPVPTTVTIEGVTMTTPTQDEAVTTGPRTLTCRKASVEDTNKRTYVFTLEGHTGSPWVSFSFTTGTAHAYLKAHCYQVALYALSQMLMVTTVGSGASLPVTIAKTAFGLAIALANRMPAISSPPPGWTVGFSADPTTSAADEISGFVNGEAPYQGPLSFSQPNATAGQHVVAITMPSAGLVYPEMLAVPTITGTPTEGVALTLNIAAATPNTGTIEVRVYQNSTPRVQVGPTIEYVVGSGSPAPTYTPTAADVTHKLVQGQTPVGTGQVGPERFSAETAAVVASGTSTPALIASNKFTFAGTSVGDGGVVTVAGVQVQRADFTILSGITVPSGYEIALLRSLSPNVTAGSAHPDIQFVKTLTQLGVFYDGGTNAIWRTTGGAPNGAYQYGYVFLKHTASGALFNGVAIDTTFGSSYRFQSVVTGGVVGQPPPNLGSGNEVKSTAQNLLAALDARIAGGSTAPWIIDLSSGNYGFLNLNGRQLPGPTTIRSQNLNLGARFSGLNIDVCKNVYFQFVDVDRTLSGAADNYAVSIGGKAQYCGISYSRIYVGSVRLASTNGWQENCLWGITAAKTTGVQTEWGHHLLIHMNLLSGPCGKQLYIDGMLDSEISDNVGENAGTDFIQYGTSHRLQFLRNWGPRVFHATWTAEHGWSHADFFQAYCVAVAQDLSFIGNVIMCSGAGSVGVISERGQGLFGSRSWGTRWLHEDNIVCSNHYHGISYTDEPVSQWSAMRGRQNTALRCIDAPGSSKSTWYRMPGSIENYRNVQASNAGDPSVGTSGLNIVITDTTRAAQEAYYTKVRMASTFYELRPVTGAVTHWDYASPYGAAGRFRRVILEGEYPKYGPAATAWQAWYNSKGQITS